MSCTKCDELRAELERVQKQCAAMRDALLEAKVTCESDSHDQSRYALTKIEKSLSPDAGQDYVSRESVKPLVAALTQINELRFYSHGVLDRLAHALELAENALARAKALGLE